MIRIHHRINSPMCLLTRNSKNTDTTINPGCLDIGFINMKYQNTIYHAPNYKNNHTVTPQTRKYLFQIQNEPYYKGGLPDMHKVPYS